jgi:SWI/SNF-related matrix-associated actin-dependent regulator 1 of chromatin subfamily A
MIITYWKGVFVADTLDEPGALRKAGFSLHEPTVCQLKPIEAGRCKACRAKIGRRWWSNMVEHASRLRDNCNERALHVMREHLSMLERSRAVDAKIEIPLSDAVRRLGWDYLPYQRGGVAYAVQRRDTLIGDDMGLGKTIQAIGFVNYVKPKSVLVVCPKSLVFNWRDEAMRWLVGDYEVWPAMKRDDEVPPRDGLFVIMNYEKIFGGRRLDASLAREWGTLIVDECHKIKNPDTQVSQAVLGPEGLMRRAQRTLFLTGTPIENYPKEIWPIAAAIAPAKFGDWWDFATRYLGLHQEERKRVTVDKETGLERQYVKKVWVDTGATRLGELQQRLRATFMVRRLKVDVMKELPPKRRQLITLEDSKVDWGSHPQFKRWKEIYDQKYDAVVARLEAAKTEDEYREAALLLEKFTGVAFEEMSAFRHETALAKLPLCLKYLDELRASGLKNVVVFAHHEDVLKRTKEHLGDDAVLLYGGTSDKNREAGVKRFVSGGAWAFLAQMRVGGAGLNLTNCKTGVFFEIDWNPGVLTQCEDRMCRIGQTEMVHIIHLILGGTLDANMVRKTVEKQAVIERTLDKLPKVHLKKRQAAG